MNKAEKPEKNNDWYKMKLGVFFVLMGALILVSLTSFWLQRQIFNTERFTTITTDAIMRETSRQSIGEVVANQILSEQPTLRFLLGDRLAGQVAGLLGTDLAHSSIERVAREAQMLVTSPAREPLVLQLSSIKTALVALQGLADRTDRITIPTSDLTVNNIPDEVVIFDTTKVPNINGVAVAISWLGPICLVLTMIGIIWWISRSSKKYRPKRLQGVALLIVAVAVVAAVSGPLIRPSVIVFGQDVQSQILLGNVYDAFLEAFYLQVWWMGGIAVLIFVLAFVWDRFIRRYKVKIVVDKIS